MYEGDKTDIEVFGGLSGVASETYYLSIPTLGKVFLNARRELRRVVGITGYSLEDIARTPQGADMSTNILVSGCSVFLRDKNNQEVHGNIPWGRFSKQSFLGRNVIAPGSVIFRTVPRQMDMSKSFVENGFTSPAVFAIEVFYLDT